MKPLLTSPSWKSMRHPYYAKSNSVVHKKETKMPDIP